MGQMPDPVAFLDLESVLPPKAACSVEGCDRPRSSKGLCHPHYKLQVRNGKPERVRVWGPGEPCTTEGCDRPRLARGLCQLHYGRSSFVTRRALVGPCPVCGGDDPPYGKDTRCRKCRHAQGITWQLRNPERAKEISRRSANKIHRERRLTVIEHYGGSCRCCGEDALAFLTIDHINGGGNAHRRSLVQHRAKPQNSGVDFYRWLVKNDFPAGFQVLCHNCNWAKSHGGCPHGNC